jgi:hypothetical protein
MSVDDAPLNMRQARYRQFNLEWIRKNQEELWMGMNMSPPVLLYVYRLYCEQMSGLSIIHQ